MPFILGPLGSGNNIGVKANSCESLLAFATDSEGHWNWQTTSSGAQATLSGSGVTAANTALYNSNSCATPTVTGNATPTTTTNIGAGSALELFFETTAAATPQLTYSSSSPTASGVVNITPN